MKIISEKIVDMQELISALKNGAVLVLPTDTVYGFVCDASNKKAVKKIFDIKGRDKSKPLPVFVKNVEMAKEYADVNEEQEKFLLDNWPGAVTIVLPAKKGLSPLVYKEKTIALREPDHSLVLGIINIFGRPLAQTSANISDNGATTKIKEVLENLKGRQYQPDIIVEAGDLQENTPSTIIDLTENKNKILRK